MKVLFLTPNINDASSYYRCSGVAPDLSNKTGAIIDVIQFDNLNGAWSNLIQYDAVMMQRSESREHAEAARYIKKMGLPLWVDYDDDLFNMPPTHISFFHYKTREAYIREIIMLADIVTVTTEALAEVVRPINANVEIIPNAIPARQMKANQWNGGKGVFWRGGLAHMADVFAYSPEIQRLINEGHTFKFMGMIPFFLQKHSLVQSRDIFQYFEYMNEERPPIMFVPLIDDKFNQAKSNIAWLEATACGAVCLATDLPEFRKPGIINFDNPRNFYNVFKKVVKMDLQEHWAQSERYIAENLILEEVNRRRAQVVGELI
jgi:O-antigen biosynthesis protein